MPTCTGKPYLAAKLVARAEEDAWRQYHSSLFASSRKHLEALHHCGPQRHFLLISLAFKLCQIWHHSSKLVCFHHDVICLERDGGGLWKEFLDMLSQS